VLARMRDIACECIPYSGIGYEVCTVFTLFQRCYGKGPQVFGSIACPNRAIADEIPIRGQCSATDRGSREKLKFAGRGSGSHA
jgi:hypothetical protein